MPHTQLGDSETLLGELAGWVRHETPTTDPAAVNRLMDVAHAGLAEAGADLTRVPGRDGFGDNLVVRTPGDRSWWPGISTPSGPTAPSHRCRIAWMAISPTARASST